MAMVIRMTTIVITTSSSTKVKPRRWRSTVRGRRGREAGRGEHASARPLPLGIRFAIGRFLISLAVHRKHILAPPTRGRGIILIAAKAPVVLPGKRVAGYFAQQLDLLAVGTIGDLHAFHEHLEGFRPAI